MFYRIIGAGLLVLLAACSNTINLTNAVVGSGVTKSETRPVSGFTSVEVSGSGEMTIEQGDSESLTIETDDNILPLITSDVNGGKLTIGTKPNTGISPKTLKYRLTVKDLNGITMSGSATITASKLNTDKLTVVASGSGVLTLSGAAADQDVQLSGSSSYQAGDLESKTVRLNISGSGKSVVKVSDKLDVKVSGSGNVEYIGSPQVTKDISGSGIITQR
jgi:hypothetical protein